MWKLLEMKRHQHKKGRILEVLSVPSRYIMSKVKSIYKKLMKKEPKKPCLNTEYFTKRSKSSWNAAKKVNR